MIDRRGFSKLGLGGLLMLLSPSAMAESIRNRLSLSRRTFPVKPDPEDAEIMIGRAVRGREITPDLVIIDLPGIAENGDAVPLTFDVASAMAGQDYPEIVHVFVKHNPFPEVARYHFGVWNGSARTEMRIRMRESSDVVIVAEMADGRVGVARQAVDVLAGACG
ncbi:thiosulfate oxidation carrier protein SoxY [Minwuia sp.]|uniref:thiosulfate oxidation carrier protein SoxY n=1 Tax=Minwuia sp. TaxID=2493630 RepID=UPI003A944A6E